MTPSEQQADSQQCVSQQQVDQLVIELQEIKEQGAQIKEDTGFTGFLLLMLCFVQCMS